MIIMATSVLAQPAEPEETPEDPITGRLVFSGPSSVNPPNGKLGFSGLADAQDPPAGSLVYSGIPDAENPPTGRLQFIGLLKTDDPPPGTLAFSGFPDGENPPNGILAFSGLPVTDNPPDGILAFSGMNSAPVTITGALKFTGCPVEDPMTALPPESPPNFLDTAIDPNIALEGNYLINWSDNEERAIAFATLTKGGDYRAIPGDDGYSLFGFSRAPDADWMLSLRSPLPASIGAGSSYADSVIIDGPGEIAIEYPYGILGTWSGKSSLSGTGEMLVGEWEYGDQTGQERWSRVSGIVSSIATVVDGELEALPVGDPLTITTPYWGPVYSARGNREDIALYVLGENLWGRHYAWIARASGLEIGRISPICASRDASGFERCEDPTRILGQLVRLNVWENARSGPHVLLFDDVEIPFNLVVTDEPPPRLTCMD